MKKRYSHRNNQSNGDDLRAKHVPAGSIFTSTWQAHSSRTPVAGICELVHCKTLHDSSNRVKRLFSNSYTSIFDAFSMKFILWNYLNETTQIEMHRAQLIGNKE